MSVNAAPVDIAQRLQDFPVQPRATVPYRIVRAVIGPLLRALFRIEVQGRENIPDGPAVIIANHLGWSDALVVVLSLPPTPRVHIIGEILGLSERTKSFVRAVGGIIPVDRARHGDGAFMEHVDQCLSSGASLLLFPEGRVGDVEGELQPFKKGFAHFATRAGLPVLPVALAGTHDLWLRRRIRVVIGPAIDTETADVDALVHTAEQSVAAIMPPCDRGRGPKLLKRWLTTLF